MSAELKEIEVEGIVSQLGSQYFLTTDDGDQYELSAILPWESVAPDYRTGIYAQYIGKRVIATGLTKGHTIWNAHLIESN